MTSGAETPNINSLLQIQIMEIIFTLAVHAAPTRCTCALIILIDSCAGATIETRRVPAGVCQL